MKVEVTLTGIARGDKAVMTRIYSEFERDFCNWIRKGFRISSEESKELFQASVVTLYENVINGKLVELRGTVKTYLFSIGKNKTLEFLRKAEKNISITGLEDQMVDDLEWDSETEYARKHELMKACVVDLGDPCQEILMLFYFKRYSLSEIKDKLSYKNEESVKSQKFKCMERLRASFLKQYQRGL